MLLRTILIAPLAATLLFGGKEEDDRLNNAAGMFEEIMGIKDKEIPQDLLDRAACAVLVPSLKKGAFIFGAKYGRGFVVCRKKDGAGWSAPGAVRVEGGSFGLQIGGSETDVVMLVMNERGATRLLSSKFTIGGDASAAAGPVGRTASAETDATMRAEILTWSRARGVFAGISLQGATLRPDREAILGLYGKEMSNKDIVQGDIAAPASAEKLLGLLNKYSSRGTK
ncbi:MAG: lipid-binding SYLF domain-containing protein [Bryobacteraceae bacterium]|nr:lipid-binding SYLF domain-containing protein [Bryobacteraceae bacterium]